MTNELNGSLYKQSSGEAEFDGRIAGPVRQSCDTMNAGTPAIFDNNEYLAQTLAIHANMNL